MEEININMLFNKVNELIKKTDKRYKEYKNYIIDIEKLEQNSKAYSKKLSIHVIVIYIIQITILIKVW